MARVQLHKDCSKLVFARQALEQDAALVAAKRCALDAARTALDLAQQCYRAGQASLLPFIEAQRLFQQARIGHLRALGQRYVDAAQLFFATRGDSDEPRRWRCRCGRKGHEGVLPALQALQGHADRVDEHALRPGVH